ncbi:MAG: hypothetical protein ACI4HI_16840 [Lachnospiraceae bacterium]
MNWYRSQERKKNNKGVSLVVVLVTISIVLILVMVIMTIALMNFRMKVANTNSAKAFYSAEQAVDEVRAGLQKELSDAVTQTYGDVITNFSKRSEEERKDLFGKRLEAALKTKFLDTTGTSCYKLSILQGYVSKPYDASTPDKVDVAEVTTKTPGVTNAIYLTNAHDFFTLKNIVVTYHGKDHYTSTIKTDIVLRYPDLDFKITELVPPLLSFSIVANNQFLAGMDINGKNTDSGAANVSVTGSAYLGKRGCIFNNSGVSFLKKAETDAMLITGGTMQLNSKADLQIASNLWAKDVMVDGSTFHTMGGTTYLENDLTLINTANPKLENIVTLEGSLYGFGNPDYLTRAKSLTNEKVYKTDVDGSDLVDEKGKPTTEKLQDIAVNPADYSSSILVNGIKASLDLSKLEDLLLSGTAYVNAKSKNTALQNDALNAGKQNSNNVQTGESISIRRNQTAYLVPRECIANKLNPMPATQLSSIGGKNSETIPEQGDTTTSSIVNYDSVIEGMGKTLRQLGVTGYQVEWYPVSQIGSMAYLFLKFDSQESADRYFAAYFDPTNRVEQSAKLKENVDLYANALVLPTSLMQDVNLADQDHFFFNGNLVWRAPNATDSTTTEQNPDITGRFTTATLLEDNNNWEHWADFSTEKEDNFVALNHKLVYNYAAVSAEEQQNDIYDNLIYEMKESAATGVKHTIVTGDEIQFVTSGEKKLAAIVKNGDYEITNTQLPVSTGGNARLCLVIANGNVTIDAGVNFKGTIIAKGNVKVNNGVKIEPDAAAVAQALLANADSNRTGLQDATPAEYVKHASAYTGNQDATGSAISVSDLVEYDNWSKDKE